MSTQFLEVRLGTIKQLRERWRKRILRPHLRVTESSPPVRAGGCLAGHVHIDTYISTNLLQRARDVGDGGQRLINYG